MADIEKKTKRYPSDLTDEEWDRVAPLLPKPCKRGRKPAVDLREILNAIRYIGPFWRRLADVAEGLSAVADGLLVVSAVRTDAAVSHHP